MALPSNEAIPFRIADELYPHSSLKIVGHNENGDLMVIPIHAKTGGRSTERLIAVLRSVNGEAFDNDHMPKPGKFIEELCHEAAARLEELL